MKNLIEDDIPLRQLPQWQKVRFGENYWADFSVMGSHILISRPSGYATLSDLQQSLNLNHEVIRTGLAENSPYIQIEDYTNLAGSTLNARKYFIQERANRENLVAVIFCAASPVMKLSIELGKRIYSTPFEIHLTNTLAEAKKLALQLLRQHDISYNSSELSDHQEPGPTINLKKEWSLQFNGFSLQFEVINDNILHPVLNGFVQKDYVDPAFAMHRTVFIESGLKDGEYYLALDLKSMQSVTIETRRILSKKFRELYQKHPFRMLIFHDTNWLIRAAINIAKTTAPYKVYVVDKLADAIDLVAKHQAGHIRSGNLSEPEPLKQDKDIHLRQLNELFTILAGISWESQTPDSILQKVGPDHPFRQVVEAISLIKMDVDHLLAEKEESEKNLIESNERYKTILDNIEEGYYEVDLAGNITFFNPPLSTILGFSEAEMKGMNYQRFSSKEDVAKIYKTFNQVFKTGQPAMALDWSLIRKDGARCFIEASVALIKDKENTPCGFRGICRDITQRIESEREKQKLAERLRQAQKMEAMGTLAGGVAHDLNNILSGIVSYPDLLLMKLPPASPLRKPIETIKKSGERAAAIVQDLLTLARRGISNREIVNLNSIIIEYLKSPEHNYILLYHPSVEVISHLDSHLFNMSASSIHMIKILMNLISNAAEAMPDGGNIHISTENYYLDTPLSGLPLAKKGDYIKLQVADEGIGMSEEDKERIFEPFYTKKAMGRSGSGLGMALVWGAVQDHDGHIDIASAPGKGTSVTIYFPAVRSDSPILQNDLALDRFKGTGERVLVVDDLQDQRELAADLLTQLGYSAKTVPSGEAAIEYLKHHQVDLVILDMIMQPGIDGLDTYKGILKIRPSQKAIIATGFSTSERIQIAQSLGAGACLKKPYLLMDMAKVIREELNR